MALEALANQNSALLILSAGLRVVVVRLHAAVMQHFDKRPWTTLPVAECCAIRGIKIIVAADFMPFPSVSEKWRS